MHQGSRSVHVPRAAAGLVGRRLDSGPLKHKEGTAGEGAVQEDTMKGGGGTVRLGEFCRAVIQAVTLFGAETLQGGCGSRGGRTAVPLQLVHNAHASGSAHKTQEDGAL